MREQNLSGLNLSDKLGPSTAPCRSRAQLAVPQRVAAGLPWEGNRGLEGHLVPGTSTVKVVCAQERWSGLEPLLSTFVLRSCSFGSPKQDLKLPKHLWMALSLGHSLFTTVLVA